MRRWSHTVKSASRAYGAYWFSESRCAYLVFKIIAVKNSFVVGYDIARDRARVIFRILCHSGTRYDSVRQGSVADGWWVPWCCRITWRWFCCQNGCRSDLWFIKSDWFKRAGRNPAWRNQFNQFWDKNQEVLKTPQSHGCVIDFQESSWVDDFKGASGIAAWVAPAGAFGWRSFCDVWFEWSLSPGYQQKQSLESFAGLKRPRHHCP